MAATKPVNSSFVVSFRQKCADYVKLPCPGWHSRGRGFDSLRLHHPRTAGFRAAEGPRSASRLPCRLASTLLQSAFLAPAERPNAHVLVSSELPSAPEPMKMLSLSMLAAIPASCPTAVLRSPVVLKASARSPAVLEEPVLKRSAPAPLAVLREPLVLDRPDLLAGRRHLERAAQLRKSLCSGPLAAGDGTREETPTEQGGEARRCDRHPEDPSPGRPGHPHRSDLGPGGRPRSDSRGGPGLRPGSFHSPSGRGRRFCGH
jgi:hypothetical protein